MKLPFASIFNQVSLEKKKISAFLLIVGAFIATLLISSSWASPTEARIAEYRHWQEMGIIDRVLSPSEAGLQYLQDDVPSIIGDEGIMSAIRRVDSSVAKLPENIPLRLPLGTNEPIAIGRLRGDTGTPTDGQQRVAVRYITPNGDTKPITPASVRPMFRAEERGNGDISKNPENFRDIKMLIADSSGNFLQAERIPVVDLIVINPLTEDREIIYDVPVNAFCRDVLNAVLTDNLVY